jgi:hypothetical protein
MKITFKATDVGLGFADASDEEQAAILNEMGRAFIMVMRNERNREMQLCYLADKLDKNGEWLVNELSEFIKHKNGLNAPTP